MITLVWKDGVIMKDNKSKAMLLIFLGWLVYSVSYFGKVNYSANITQIIDYYGITRAQAGTAPTFFFFAYGIGQVFNGIFCKKYNIKWMIFFSLVMSATINLIVAVSKDFAIIKWLWLLNGIVLSILWPTLIRMISESIPQKVLGTSSIIMGTTVGAGTLVIYGLSSIFAAFDKFKLSFYTASFSVFIVAFLWLLIYNKAVSSSQSEKELEEPINKETWNVSKKGMENKNEKKLFYISVGVLCFGAIGANLIKDGLTTWVPSILKEEFSMSDSISILLTLFLPILAMCGNAFALSLHKKIPDYVNHLTAVFAAMAVLVGMIIGSIALELVVVMLFGLIAVNFLASSLNSLITSIYPLFMREKVNSGSFAGILNGFCCLGSTISSYGLGVIADNFGWTAVFWTLIGFSVAVCITWCGYKFAKYIFEK